MLFTCVASGKPLPYISWTQNNSNNGNGSQVTITETLFQDEHGVTLVKSVMEVCGAVPAHTGIYSCTANNIFGSDSAIFELLVHSEGTFHANLIPNILIL